MSARIGAPVQFWASAWANSHAPYSGAIVAINGDGTVKVRASSTGSDMTSGALHDCVFFGMSDTLGTTGDRCQALYD